MAGKEVARKAGAEVDLAGKKPARTRPATTAEVAVRETGTVARLYTAVADSIVLPTPGTDDGTWGPVINTAITEVAAAVDDVQTQLGTKVSGQACTTDGTDSLPSPTGTGLEFVINSDGLDDIRFNGVSL